MNSEYIAGNQTHCSPVIATTPLWRANAICGVVAILLVIRALSPAHSRRFHQLQTAIHSLR